MSFYLVGGCYFFSLLAPVFGMRGGETMRRKKMSIIVAVFAMLFGLAQVAGASIPNHFVSTSSESNTVTIDSDLGGLTDGWYFGVYDYGGDPSSGSDHRLDLLSGSSTSLFQSANFSVTYDGSDYWITVISGDFTSQSPLDIGSSGDFSFYFRNGSTYDTNFSITGGSLNYGFASYNGGAVIGTDLASVPLPSSAIFLFSGFVGLVAFGGRRKIMK